MPISQFRHKHAAAREVETGIHVFQPEYLGRKFSALIFTREWQWKRVTLA